MKKSILLAVTVFSLYTLNSQNLIPDGGGEVDYAQPSNCLSNFQKQQIQLKLTQNKKLIQSLGAFENLDFLTLSTTMAFDFPLQKIPELSFPGFYAISNFVDHDPLATGTQYGASNEDYNCGNRTYDTNSGYNHSGIDYRLFPFAWYMYENNLVEVIAAESGIIIGKDDGNEDDHCSCSGDWNAVYVEHSDGSTAWYGHLKSDLLTSKQVGEMVAKGEYLGIVASSGCSSGPHLHFEVYDNANNLIDPFSGACNDLNSNSWWSSQPAYHESQINAILTHSSPPILDCPTNEEIPNFSNEFSPGDLIIVAVYYRDRLIGDVTNLRLVRPDGSIWTDWNFTSSNNFVTSYNYWNRILPQNASFGTWTFEADYKGITYSHNFQVLGVDNDNDGFDTSTDCDDNNPNINPNATEICDGLDNNCNDNIDEGLEITFYADLDNDGFGNPDSPMIDCVQPANSSTNNEDCDDNNPNINPNGTEVCDDLDNNCNGDTDEGLEMTFYADLDNDGFGNPDSPVVDCVQPANSSTNNEDCDDNNPNINPNATEIPNNVIDEDCDGMDLITSIRELDGSKILLYPNPAFYILTVELSTYNLNLEYKIRSVTGMLIKSGLLEQPTNYIDVSKFPSGNYSIEIRNTRSGNSNIQLFEKI